MNHPVDLFPRDPNTDGSSGKIQNFTAELWVGYVAGGLHNRHNRCYAIGIT